MNKYTQRLLFLFVCMACLCPSVRAEQTQRCRVIVSTDIGGTDPDDNQSMAHLLMCSDRFDLEGLISSPSFGDGRKEEILRMIDVYEHDLPTLRRHASSLMEPDALRRLVKQGRTSEAPACGYGKPTEGSRWIVRQARRPDPRPLYVLVWGCLEDVAQALHDAPDIAPRLRVHWIGGPNKKWGVNSYCYIAENFPDLWMIENNTTYRGFIYDSKNSDEWNTGYFDAHIRRAGHLGRDFAAYYKGNPKMGDTPSLLYCMSGDPAQPSQPSWAGSFVRCSRTPRTVFFGATTAQDTAQICSIIEWQLEGPKRNDIAIDSACITLDIRNQQWRGYYKGNGRYVVRHSTYYTGTLDYTITSTVDGFTPIQGQVTIANTWNTSPKATDYVVGSQWWTDSYAPDTYWHDCAGAATQQQARQQPLADWAERWDWLRDAANDAFKGVWPVTDPAMMRSLNGEWQLKVVQGIADDHTVPAADNSWGRIPVPGCWEAYGFCQPRYDYPDSLTGYYRTKFTVPREWRGQQVFIRLDGVLRGYDLWLNDQWVGTWESAYNTCLFDLTPYLRKKGPQQLAMRVYTRFKGYEFDCFDDWATNGIFRDVTLMAVPQTHLSDLTVTTRMNGEVKVVAEVAGATKHTATTFELQDAQGKVVLTENGIVPDVKLWTAETPYLYTLRVRVKEKGRVLQTFTQKIGIKEVSIEGRSASPLDSVKNVLMLNGQPIKLRGVNAHSTDPRTVKVISDSLTLRDMHMMKEASVNYMRLSHYPREPRFYELADSLGFYLVSEVPFGYGDKHLSSRSYQDILYTRANATLRRDKNHPSVLVWSVGNENPLPQTCVEVGDSVARLDPSRPYCYPQVGSYFRRFWSPTPDPSPNGEGSSHPFPSKAPIYAPHYPTTGQIGGFYQHLDRPVIFTEYCHTLGQSFEDHDRQWDIIERTPGIAGGSVWEWADQGMPFKDPLSSPHGEKNAPLSSPHGGKMYGYEERVYTVGRTEGGPDGFEMYGNKGTDGLVYADRTPLPNYYELQHNYARAFVSLTTDPSPKERGVRLRLHNRYDFLNLEDNVYFHWALTADRDTVARGVFSPDCAPHDSVAYSLALPQDVVLRQESLQLLHFTLTDAQGHTFLHQSFVLNKPEQQWASTGNPMQLVQQGPLVRTGRKPTLAERIKQEGRLPEKYLLPLENSNVAAQVQVDTMTDGGQDIAFVLTPDTADVFRAELGLAFLLDPAIDRVQWIGQGPFAAYPGRHQACRYGFWAKHKDDLYFEGNHQGVDACWLSDKDGNGVLITAPLPSEGDGGGLNINFEQTDRGIVVTVNAAVSGLGPKFARTAFNGWKPDDGPVSARFTLRRTRAGQCPRLFLPADSVPTPFHPFETQYDTYLMRFNDIK